MQTFIVCRFNGKQCLKSTEKYEIPIVMMCYNNACVCVSVCVYVNEWLSVSVHIGLSNNTKGNWTIDDRTKQKGHWKRIGWLSAVLWKVYKHVIPYDVEQNDWRLLMHNHDNPHIHDSIMHYAAIEFSNSWRIVLHELYAELSSFWGQNQLPNNNFNGQWFNLFQFLLSAISI